LVTKLSAPAFEPAARMSAGDDVNRCVPWVTVACLGCGSTEMNDACFSDDDCDTEAGLICNRAGATEEQNGVCLPYCDDDADCDRFQVCDELTVGASRTDDRTCIDSLHLPCASDDDCGRALHCDTSTGSGDSVCVSD